MRTISLLSFIGNICGVLENKEFVNGTKRYAPKKYSGFDKNSEALGNLQLMFERAAHIPIWIVSYNDRSFPDIDTMIK